MVTWKDTHTTSCGCGKRRDAARRCTSTRTWPWLHPWLGCQHARVVRTSRRDSTAPPHACGGGSTCHSLSRTMIGQSSVCCESGYPTTRRKRSIQGVGDPPAQAGRHNKCEAACCNGQPNRALLLPLGGTLTRTPKPSERHLPFSSDGQSPAPIITVKKGCRLSMSPLVGFWRRNAAAQTT
jgi:hypothetical protein